MSNHPGDPTWRAMIDETMKIPEPIIEPATSIVESNNPSPLTSFCSATGASVTALAIGIPWIGGELIINRVSGATPKSCSNHFTGKREACSLPATDDLKSSAACTTVAVGLLRCSGFGYRISCHAAWHFRADGAAVRSIAACPLATKSFVAARLH